MYFLKMNELYQAVKGVITRCDKSICDIMFYVIEHRT